MMLVGAHRSLRWWQSHRQQILDKGKQQISGLGLQGKATIMHGIQNAIMIQD